MGGGLDFRELFLSADGRIARMAFWLGASLLFLLTLTYEVVVSPTLHWVTGWFVYPLLVYPGVCVLSKRLHDRGRSGWFAAPIILGLTAVFYSPFGFFDLAWGIVLFWGLVELGLMPGEQGANRFGLNPMLSATT
jgi:uncharacterized membrane protein YhaH (DUF805 family)